MNRASRRELDREADRRPRAVEQRSSPAAAIRGRAPARDAQSSCGRATRPVERYHFARARRRELRMRACADIDVDRERIAADDPARRMHDDRLADVGALGVERLLHAQRADMLARREHACARPSRSNVELEPRLPSGGRSARRAAASVSTRHHAGVARRASSGLRRS